MRKLLTIAATSLAILAVAAGPVSANNGKGPPHIGFYVDGDQYRTVGTNTDFSNTGAPASSFDTIYALGNDVDGNPLLNVASSKPGDQDFNGGRWMVLPVTWNIDPVQLYSEEQVLYFASMNWLDIASQPAAMFECPVIPVHS